MSFVIFVTAFALAVLIGVPLSLYVMRSIRRSGKRSAGFVIAAALMFGFPFMGDRGPALIEEAKDETGRKKDQGSGEPPTPGMTG